MTYNTSPAGCALCPLTDSINDFPGVSLHHGMNPNTKRPIIPLCITYFGIPLRLIETVFDF